MSITRDSSRCCPGPAFRVPDAKRNLVLAPRRVAPHFALNGRQAMQRFLIITGIVLLALGLLWPFIQRIGLGRLPGDIVVERPGFTRYFPIVTSIVISI